MSRDNSYLVGNKFAAGAGPNQTSFKPGIVPWNKGLKGWSPPGSRATQFKKGVPTGKAMPEGSITIRADKNGKRRRFIKTGGRWLIYATWLWESSRGKIPPGLMVHHLDHDSLNDALSNYGLVTRSQHINEHRSELLDARKRNGVSVGKGYVRAPASVVT